jgi:hypothetical protein
MAGTVTRILSRYFYLMMSLLIAGIVAYGFGNTIEANLLHPSFPRPPSLYAHAAVFAAWVLLLIAQSSLVLTRHVRWHRWLGWAGVVLGCLIPVLGVTAALQMTHVRAILGDSDDVAFLIVAFYDMAAFAIAFALAVYWRKQPEIHRRLMLIATCGLSVAAFSRFPPEVVPQNFGYIFVDSLILLGVLRDLVVIRRAHPVYLWALPIIISAQIVANLIYMTAPRAWMNVAYWLIR